MSVVIEKTFVTDLAKPIVPVRIPEPLYHDDALAHELTVEAKKGGVAETLTGSVICYFMRANGTTVVIDGTISSGKAKVTLPASCYLVSGGFRAAVRVTNESTGVKQTILMLEGNVLETSTDSIVDPSHVIPSIDELLAQIAACEAATDAAETAAGTAETAATAAGAAAEAAEAAAGAIDDMTVEAETLETGAAATATVTDVQGHKHILFGLPKGDTGSAPTVTSTLTHWQESTSGTTIPTGTWTTTIPTVTAGHFLWSRTTVTFDTGDEVVTYTVSRFGIDGSGAVSSVNGYSPDGSGNVELPNASTTAAGLMSAAQVTTLAGHSETIASHSTDIANHGTAIGALESDVDDLENEKTDKSTLTTATLSAASWVGSAAPYTYTLSVTGVTATSAVEILAGASVTAEQLEELQAANIQDGGQSAGSITLKAYGEKPAINLPIRIIVRGDL